MLKFSQLSTAVAALVVVALLCIESASAQTPSVGPKIGVGVFGGLTLPVVQDDQKSGSVFGFYARVKLIPLIVLEPNVAFVKYGDPDPINGIDLGIVGSKITSFGVDATLGGAPGSKGVNPYFHAGAASYSIKNDDTGFDQSMIGYSGGLGILIGLGLVDLDLRGKAIVIPLDEGGSKKSLTATVGLTYALGM